MAVLRGAAFRADADAHATAPDTAARYDSTMLRKMVYGTKLQHILGDPYSTASEASNNATTSDKLST